MYLLAFSILLLCSALNLKAQGEQLEEQMGLESPSPVPSLFLSERASGTLGSGSQAGGAMTADLSKPLLSDAESEFYEVMCQALAVVDCKVMAKVNLEDVVRSTKLDRQLNSRLQKSRSKLDRKHVAFVICWGDSLNILAIVRLDPMPGVRPLQRLMHRRVDELLDEIGIPVVLFPAADSYDPDEILAALTPHLV